MVIDKVQMIWEFRSCTWLYIETGIYWQEVRCFFLFLFLFHYPNLSGWGSNNARRVKFWCSPLNYWSFQKKKKIHHWWVRHLDTSNYHFVTISPFDQNLTILLLIHPWKSNFPFKKKKKKGKLDLPSSLLESYF